MTYPLPEGEDLRRAVKWVSAAREERGGQPLYRLVEEAVFKFDLSPKDAEFLTNFFRQDAAHWAYRAGRAFPRRAETRRALFVQHLSYRPRYLPLGERLHHKGLDPCRLHRSASTTWLKPVQRIIGDARPLYRGFSSTAPCPSFAAWSGPL